MKKILFIFTILFSFISIHADDVIWTGSVNSSWHTAGNWQSGLVPSNLDVAIFKSTSSNNAVISSNINIGGLRIESGYFGTITQSGGSITIGVYGYSQSGGTFVGGSSAISVNGYFTQDSGFFTATSGALTLSGAIVSVTGGVFYHNNGTICKTGGGATWNITQSIKNLNINTPGNFDTTVLRVLGNVDAHGWNVHYGTIEVEGNYTTYFASQSGSNGKVVFKGSNNQLLSANGSAGCISGVEVNKTGGVLTVHDTIIVPLDWNNISSGANVDVSTAEIKFVYENDITSNGMVFNNVTVQCPGWFNAVDKMTINGLAKFASFNSVNGLIEVTGNVVLTGQSQSTSSAILRFVGSNNQTLSANGGYGVFANIKFQKMGGTLTVSDTIKLSQGLTWVSGAVNASASTFVFYGGTQTIDAEGMNFNNVEINSQGSIYLTRPLKVDGNLTVTGINLIEGERVEVKGNITDTNTFFWGNGVETYLVGSNNQSISFAGTSGLKKSIYINKAGGTVSLGSNLSLNSGWQNINVVSGAFDLNGFNLSLGGVLKNSGTVKLIGSETVAIGGLDNSGQGTVAYTGTGSYSALALGDDYFHLNIAGSVTQENQLSVLGDLNITGTLNSNGYNLYLAGKFNNTGTYTSGANSVYLIGGNQIIVGSNSFNNLIKRSNATASLTFPAGSTQTVSGTLELVGTTGNLLTLKSSTANSVWSINHSGSVSRLGYLNISDSTSISTLDAKSNSVDGGNNTNWVFNGVNSLVWSGAVDTNFSNGGNWVGGVAPTVNGVAEFLSGSNNIVIDIDANVAGIVLGSGFSGSVTLAANKTLNVGYNGITISGGVFNGNAKTITSTGDLVISGGTFNSSSASVEIIGSVQISGGTFNSSTTSLKVGGNWTKTGGTFEALGPVTFNGFGGQTVLAGGTSSSSDFADFIVSFGTVTIASALKVNGSVTVNSGQLKNNSNIQLAGSLTNNSGFINDQIGSTWVLNGTVAQNVKLQNHIVKTIQISNTSNKVTFLDELNATELIGDAGSSIVIEKGKFVVLSTLTLNGTLAQPIKLKSSIVQQNAHVTVSGAQTVSFVDVRGIDGQFGPTLNGTNNCVDLGYNVNWVFPDNSGKPVISFTPASDIFENVVAVSISSTGTTPIIYYTLDGSIPTTSSAIYSAPLNLTATTTIKTISVDGANTSNIFGKVYQAVQSAIDDGLVYPVKSYGLNALIYLGDVRRFEGQAFHVGPDGIMNTSDDYRVPEFDKYIQWSATQGTILKITDTGGAVFTGNGSTNYYTVTLTLGNKSFTGCNNNMPIRASGHGCQPTGTLDNSVHPFPNTIENEENHCCRHISKSLPNIGDKVELEIIRDAGFYNLVPFSLGKAARMSGFNEVKEISGTRVNILFVDSKAAAWFPFDALGTTGKYYRDGGDQGYAEKIMEGGVLTGYQYTDAKGNISVFKKSIGTKYFRISEKTDLFGKKIIFDYQSPSFLLITDASGNRYEITANNAIEGVNQITSVVIKPFGSSLSKTWSYDYSASGFLTSETFEDLFADFGYGRYVFASDIHGNPTLCQDYKGFQYTAEYDDAWRVTKSILPTGSYTTKEYSGKNGSYDVKITDTENKVTTITRNQTPYRVVTTKVVDNGGVKTELTYNSKGFLTQKKTKPTTNPADDVTLTYEYNSDNYPIKETLLPVELNVFSINEWDSRGNLTKTIDQKGNINVYTYTAQNKLDTQIENSGVLNLTTSFTYNSTGNLTTHVDPSGNIRTFESNNLGLVTKETSEKGIFSRTFDFFGNMDSAKDNFKYLNVYENDINNRLVTSTDFKLNSKHFEYDGNNNLTKFIDKFGDITNKTFNSINQNITINGVVVDALVCPCQENQSMEKEPYIYGWNGKFDLIADSKYYDVAKIKANIGECEISSPKPQSDDDIVLKEYLFHFKSDSNNNLDLNYTNILDVKLDRNSELTSDYKTYDIAYLDISGNVIYVDSTIVDMQEIDFAINSSNPSLVVKVLATGPEKFYSMKFLPIKDASLVPADSTKINLESANHLYSKSKKTFLSTAQDVSQNNDMLYYFLRDHQVFPKLDPNHADEFPLLKRGVNVHRLLIASTGFNLLDTTVDSNNLTDRNKYDAAIKLIVENVRGNEILSNGTVRRKPELDFHRDGYEKNLVIYDLDKAGFDSDIDGLGLHTENDRTYGALPINTFVSNLSNIQRPDTSTSRFGAYLLQTGLNTDSSNSSYWYYKLIIDSLTVIDDNILGYWGYQVSALDSHAIIAPSELHGEEVRPYCTGFGRKNSGGVYLSCYPFTQHYRDPNINLHEFGHLFFNLSDEYQLTRVDAKNLYDISKFQGDINNSFKWKYLPWNAWIDWDGSETLSWIDPAPFGMDNAIPFTETQISNYLGQTNYNNTTVFAFPAREQDVNAPANSNHVTPCIQCLMRYGNEFCTICKEVVYNKIIGDIIIENGISPNTGQVTSSTGAFERVNLTLNTLEPLKPITFKVECTDKFYPFENINNPPFYTYTWFLHGGSNHFPINSHPNFNPALPNQIVFSYENLNLGVLENGYRISCQVSYSDKSRVRTKDNDIKYLQASDEYIVMREVSWVVTNANSNIFIKNQKIEAILDKSNFNSKVAFDLNITGDISKPLNGNAQFTMTKPFDHGFILVPNLNAMVYQSYSGSFYGVDSGEFKVENSKGFIVKGTIYIYHAETPVIYNKTITIYKNSNGSYPVTEINFVNGEDYISKYKYNSISFSDPTKGKFVNTGKKYRGYENRVFYKPAGYAGTEIITASIWDNITNTRISANLTIIVSPNTQ